MEDVEIFGQTPQWEYTMLKIKSPPSPEISKKLNRAESKKLTAIKNTELSDNMFKLKLQQLGRENSPM